MGRVSLVGLRCAVCTWEWRPRVGALPAVCPRCKSGEWDRDTLPDQSDPVVNVGRVQP